MMPGETRTTGRVMVCRRCQKLRTTRGRGLCKRCWLVAREKYPLLQSPERGPGEATANATPPLPERPTAYRPGTVGKLAVMMQRVERGVQPHHPDDGRL